MGCILATTTNHDCRSKSSLLNFPLKKFKHCPSITAVLQELGVHPHSVHCVLTDLSL